MCFSLKLWWNLWWDFLNQNKFITFISLSLSLSLALSLHLPVSLSLYLLIHLKVLFCLTKMLHCTIALFCLSSWMTGLGEGLPIIPIDNKSGYYCFTFVLFYIKEERNIIYSYDMRQRPLRHYILYEGVTSWVLGTQELCWQPNFILICRAVKLWQIGCQELSTHCRHLKQQHNV